METAARPPSLGAIFGVFLRLGMASFGGGLPGWMHREVVRRRGWLDEERFMAGLSLGQVLPGPNSVNLALYIGQRLRGWPGAAAAFFGILGPPFLFILALSAAQARIADLPLMTAALGGVAAAGLANSCAVGALAARRVRGAGLWGVAVATFVAVGLLRWPMTPSCWPWRRSASASLGGRRGRVGADRLLALALVFAPISLVSLGGGPSVFAEMQRQSVEVHGWLSAERFLDLFAVSRAAPGPGSLIAALVGWEAAGFAGAAVAALALYVPSSLLLLMVGQWWRRADDAPLRRAVERGLAPVAVGLIFAGVVTLARGDGTGWLGVATMAVCTAALLRGASPYRVMLAAALAHAGWAAALG